MFMCCEEQVLMQQKLDKVIEDHKDMQGALIPVLHEAQSIYGYLPYEVMKRIAEGLQIPVAKVYGVATFYSQFSLEKKGKYRINVCMGTACYVKGSGDILNKFRERLGIEVGECTDDGLFSLESCRCIGACGLAPVITINDEVYGRLTEKDIDAIIDKYEGMEA
ncbi:MAG: NADH-quinone oxidoreductase subunit NuoE [Firmicutes bacterium]|nr:NADH-quinone oxidoreductase subunit NuoE [Bacillota bacterium]MBR1989817.1 NADH-quinone oxidoreductase subunit NuoE [Bacillota bacterium]MBR6584581.1 NADH-quinone oxidoreductase subunit NuoE [Bacillota bacterium]